MRIFTHGLCLLFVSGCAARVPPAPTPPVPRPPLVEAAIAEWEAWGKVTIVGWPIARPLDTAATPDRFARLMGYWQAVPGGGQVAHRHSRLRFSIHGALPTDEAEVGAFGWEDIGLYARPAWSAAFISATARNAAVPEQDLPSASRHASYIDAVLVQASRDPTRAAYLPYAPEERAPRPGDLLCSDRSAAPLAHWSMRLASLGKPRAMHCDVVVSTAPGVIEAVGGNVQDLVTLRQLPSDAEGRVLPAPPGFPRFVVVLAAQPEGKRGD